MGKFSKSRRDFWQNIAITLLSVCAVALFTQTQLYNLNLSVRNLSFNRLLSSSSKSESQPDLLTDLSSPVRVAITGDYYGRFAKVDFTTVDSDFRPLGDLLSQMLGSAREYTPCDSSAFLQGLQQTSVYYDFLNALPLSLISGMVGGEAVSDEISARYLLGVVQNSQVTLYLWDGGSTYLYTTTAVSPNSVTEVTSLYELGSASFALDGQLPHTGEIAPCSLLPDTLEDLPVLSSTPLSAEESTILSALNFNPHTNFRYTESGGAEVIVEDERILRLYPDSSLAYQSGGSDYLRIESSSDSPALQETVMGVYMLLCSLLPPEDSQAGFYLESVRITQEQTTLIFNYQLQGLPIYFSNGDDAAIVTLSGNVVDSLTVRLRQYTAEEEVSLLLPLRQSLGVAAQESPGAELALGYVDDSSGTLSAAWLSL